LAEGYYKITLVKVQMENAPWMDALLILARRLSTVGASALKIRTLIFVHVSRDT
jgi:hypothetical protein